MRKIEEAIFSDIINHLYKDDRKWLSKELLRLAAIHFEKAKEWIYAAELRQEIGDNVHAAEIYKKAGSQNLAAQAFLTQGLYEEALNCYENWIKCISEKDIIELVSANLGISACLKLLGKDRDRAMLCYFKAREQIKNMEKKNNFISGSLWENLGIYGQYLKRYDLICIGYEKALEYYGKEHSKEYIRTAKAYLEAEKDNKLLAKDIKRRIFEFKQFEQNKLYFTNSIGMKFRYIEPGSFMMGSPDSDKDADDDEKPRHRVTLTKGFYIGVYPVTQREWIQVMGNNPSDFKEFFQITKQIIKKFSDEGIPQNIVDRIEPLRNITPLFSEDEFIQALEEKVEKDEIVKYKSHIVKIAHVKGDNYPVDSVSWEDFQIFISKLNELENDMAYRLLTEAEWEYACRAGSETQYYFGDYDQDWLDHYGWYLHSSLETTHPVGELMPNRWGLYDMHGNVFEWCQDWYESYSSMDVIDPKGPSTGSHRVLRGGDFADLSESCRSARREKRLPSEKISYWTFSGGRLAFSPNH